MNKKDWKEFYIKDIFITEKNNTQVPTGAYIHKNNLLKGKIPRVTVTTLNNGIYGFYESKHANFRVFNNFISVSFLGGIFYHPYKASLDMKVHCLQLKNKELNYCLSMFLIAELSKSIQGASYGNQLSSTDLPNKKILLPVDENSCPDYEYMEKCIKELENFRSVKYIHYINSNYMDNISFKNIDDLNNKTWKEFFLTDVFQNIKRGKRLTKSCQIDGKKPYVSSSGLMNGVDNFISNEGKVRKYYNCLSLANSGSVGSCFYHGYEFVASDHVTHLKNDSFDKYTYLFIASMASRLSEKYNFNREINDERINREKILLPVNEKGSPDYLYMQQYVKNTIFKLLNKYLKFINKKTTD